MSEKPVSVKIRNEKEVRQTIGRDFPDFARFAVANTATRIAFLGMERSEDQWRHDFHLRNRFLIGSRPGVAALKYNRAIPHHDLNKIESSWGSPDRIGNRDYSFLEEQEEGWIHKGIVPTKDARISRAEQKRLRKKSYIQAMKVRKLSDIGSSRADTIPGRARHMLHASYLDGFGLPGSNQFFYLKDDEYGQGWEAGFYQFSRSTPPRTDTTYPNLRRIYYDGKSTQKKRKATHWMEKSKNTITQRDIEEAYKKEFDQAFTRELKRSRR